jgi:hypothetical protein
MLPPTYSVSHQAYLKIFFHAAKHPHKPVNGVLVGKPSGESGAVIVDAIPLLHNWTSLSPMMEIGLDLVSGVYVLNKLHRIFIRYRQEDTRKMLGSCW